MSDPKLAEAVRIVREQTIPALAGSGGGGHVEALETVLAALERAQGELAACDGHGYLRAEIERLKVCVIYLEQAGRERDEARAEILRYQNALTDAVGNKAHAEAEVERLREAAQVLAGAVGDVLTGWDAHRQLAQGGGGMGHNILIESVGRYQSIYCWGRLRKAYDAMSAVLATAQPEEPPATTIGLCVCGTCPRCLYYAAGLSGRGYAPTDALGDARAEAAERHWQDDAEPNPGRAQAAYQAQREREKP